MERAALDVEAERQACAARLDRLARRAPSPTTSCTRCAPTLPGTSVVDQVLARAAASSIPTTGLSGSYSTSISAHGVLGEVAVAGDDHDHRLADVADDVLGQRVRGAAVGAAPGAGSAAAAARPTAPGQVLPGVDGDQPVHVQRGDTSMSTIRACACGDRTNAAASASRAEVVEVPARCR